MTRTLKPKPYEIFTDEHHKAIATACEKLWNGEPVENPICSPRPRSHPLVRIANETHAALNAVEAMRVAYEIEIAALRRRLRSARNRPPSPPAKASAQDPDNADFRVIGGKN